MRMAVSADPTTRSRGREGRVWVDSGGSIAVLRMAGIGVRREKAALSSGCKAHPAMELQTQTTGLNAVLADPDLYARDPGRFVATSQALAIARDELAAAEEQWLTLEMLREQIDDDERKS